MRHRRLLILGSIVAVAPFALLAAGCGGGGSPAGVASVASSTTAGTTPTPTQNGLVAFASCMRSHGVPSFPDPDSSGEILKIHVEAAARANQHAFDTAQTACIHLAPSGSLAPPPTAQQKRIQLADKLSFAKCMRSRGVAGFPDPTAQGDLSVEMVQAQGIDVHSPAVLHVVQACLPASHGALTAAKVEEALKNASSG